MTQEEKDLLFKELSARHPYGVKLQVRLDYSDNEHKEGTYDADIEAITSYNIECTYYDTNIHGKIRDWTFRYEEVKPYLRPMSSMTEEEVNEYNQYWEKDRDDIMIVGKHFEEMYKSKKFTLYMHPVVPMYRHILWLLENHFDFMGLIPKGLAIEVTKENNPYK